MTPARTKNIHHPPYFTLQWHLTEKCNWRCRHCYHEARDKQELPFSDCLKIFRQYLDLLAYLKMPPGRTRLSLTGGEPLVRNDFFKLLEAMYPYNRRFLLSLFSNGSLIDKENVKRLKKTGVRSIQFSLEGMEENNDRIRGKGAFQLTENALQAAIGQGINTVVSVTMTKDNLGDMPSLIEYCAKMKVNSLGFRRLVPIGRGKAISQKVLSPEELKGAYFYIELKKRELSKKKDKLIVSRGCEEGVFSRETGQETESCALLDKRVLVVMPDADVLACRRLPLKLGNALKNSLTAIYTGSAVLSKLMDRGRIASLCKNCKVFNLCSGGAKCMSYAFSKSTFAPDPQCWS